MSRMTPCDTLPMSTVKLDLDDPGFWTEEAFLSLGETKTKIELIDGGLWVSPASNVPHNEIAATLLFVLKSAVRDSGLRAVAASNLRTSSDKIFVPDLMVGRIPREAVTVLPSQLTLVAEVTSPGNATVDRILKRALYAQAGIDWYLLVEPDFDNYKSVSLQLLRRVGNEYVLHEHARHGETLSSNAPFPIEVDTVALLDF
jgi:Uma2 family endonuclease